MCEGPQDRGRKNFVKICLGKEIIAVKGPQEHVNQCGPRSPEKKRLERSIALVKAPWDPTRRARWFLTLLRYGT